MTNEITDTQIDVLEATAKNLRDNSPWNAFESLKHNIVMQVSPVDLLAFIARLRKAEAKPELAADERERFERAIHGLIEDPDFVNSDEIGDYLHPLTSLAYSAWQAAKADAAEQITRLENTLEIERDYSRNLALQMEQMQAQVERAVRHAVEYCVNEIDMDAVCTGDEKLIASNILRELAEQNNKESWKSSK